MNPFHNAIAVAERIREHSMMKYGEIDSFDSFLFQKKKKQTTVL
jgi:hypothetical protein